MYINGIDIEDYSAKLLSDPVIEESNIDLSYLKAVGGTALTLFNQEFGVKEMKITLEITGKDRNNVYLLKSYLLKALQGVIDIVLTDGFIYRSILSAISSTKQITTEIIQVELKFYCMQCGQLETVNLENSGIIDNDGTMKSDCSITFHAYSNISDFWFMLNDMVVYIDTLEAGKDFLIDGLNKSVMNGIENAINLTDLVDFPKLDSGRNTLTLSAPVDVTIQYYPVYL